MNKGMYKFALFVTLSLGAALCASGQVRGGAAPVRGISRPARAVASRPGGRTPPRVGTALHSNFAPIRRVPGLGFDFAHLAAISQPIRDRSRFEHRQIFPFITPIFGTLPFYSEIPDYYSEAEQQPQFILMPQQPQQQQGVAPPPREANPEAAPAASQFPAPPPPELGQLILVRQDGRALLAVAFTTVRGQLIYITREGIRRSFPVSELDKAATREMNDANGTSVSLPE